MTIVAKIGTRIYEMSNTNDVAQCRDIYATHTGDQNSLETKFEEASIDFGYELIDAVLA